MSLKIITPESYTNLIFVYAYTITNLRAGYVVLTLRSARLRFYVY